MLILGLFFISIIFRGAIYRSVITYESVSIRNNYNIYNKQLINLIDEEIKDKNNLSEKDIIKIGLKITNKQLNFTASNNDLDPNKLVESKTAHCVGYSYFCASVCNYIFEKQDINDVWVAKPRVGKLFLLGNNIHQYFNSSFFKDHDFVTIENKKTGEIFAIDPSLNDYLYINYVKFR